MMLELKEIHAYYGKSHILHNIEFHIEKGELVTLLGRNGMGKSTTLKCIMGIIDNCEGIIKFNSNNIVGKKSYQIFNMGLGYVPQGRKIFSSLTVEENLMLTKKNNHDETLDSVLNRFARLKSRLKHRGNQLSGGEQQMLAIARILISKPQLILYDEPSEGLAPLIEKEIINSLIELKETGMTSLLVEANLNVALKCGDRHYIMDQGRIAFEPSTRELVENDELIDKYFKI